jgi:lauroyl/myristoyl acyltransferase
MGAEINERFVDPDAREAAVQQIDPSRGTLVLLAHVGFPTVRAAFFSDAFPAGRHLSNNKKLSARIELAGKDQGLFEAYKSLKNSEMVLMAPDGLLGTNNATIEVLGEPVEIKDGAAFLAYESRCCTAWFAIAREGTRFFPSIMRGPERRDDESFSKFKERLFAFYELMLSNHFTGDPRNLVYGPPWISLFGRK